MQLFVCVNNNMPIFQGIFETKSSQHFLKQIMLLAHLEKSDPYRSIGIIASLETVNSQGKSAKIGNLTEAKCQRKDP